MWTYKQSIGELSRNGIVIAVGYAGYALGKNNPSFESVKSIGPLPRGLYTIGAPYFDKRTGPYTLSLTPAVTNNMFGRSDFKIHGDSELSPGNGSEGCIVMSPSVRQLIWASGDRGLVVVI